MISASLDHGCDDDGRLSFRRKLQEPLSKDDFGSGRDQLADGLASLETHLMKAFLLPPDTLKGTIKSSKGWGFRNEARLAILDDFGISSNVGRQNRAVAHHGLHCGNGQPFMARRYDKDVMVVPHGLYIAYKSTKKNTRLQSKETNQILEGLGGRTRSKEG
jgi:hypothetical protein